MRGYPLRLTCRGMPRPYTLAFAIPDHPWVDSAEGAAVRIAMTVGAAGEGPGVLQQVISERLGDNDAAEIILAECRGRILPDLTTGSNVTGAQPLQANGSISGRGVQLFGSGFIVTPQEAANLGLGALLTSNTTSGPTATAAI